MKGNRFRARLSVQAGVKSRACVRTLSMGACIRTLAVIACCFVALGLLIGLPQMNEKAFAKTVTDQETGRTYEHSKLPDGSYTLPVELRQATDITKPSMAGAALDGTANLVVNEGQYRLSLTIGTIEMGSIIGYVSRIDYYPDYKISGSSVKTQGDAIKVWSSRSSSDKGPAKIPVLTGNPMKETAGYIPLALYSKEMPVSPQKAALLLKWADLEVVSLNVLAEKPSNSSVNKSKLKKTLNQARAALNRGGKTSAATKELKRAIKRADKVYKKASATQKQVNAQRKKLTKALKAYKKAKAPAHATTKDSAFSSGGSQSGSNKGSNKSLNRNSTSGAGVDSSGSSGSGSSSGANSSYVSNTLTVANEGYQVGSTYSVPMTFTKAGSDEKSMAAQYFGTKASVVPQQDGTYEVRFTTNRADYVTSISYNGSVLSGSDGSGTERTYTMYVPAVETDATYLLAMSIKPMQELGTDSVDVDLRLNFSQGTNTSTGSAALASAASSSQAVGGNIARTGDALKRDVVSVAMFIAAAAFVACVIACSKLRTQGRVRRFNR